MIDFWSLGCLIYEMIFGVPAFYQEAMNERIQRILNGKIVFPSKQTVTSVSKDLIKKLL